MTTNELRQAIETEMAQRRGIEHYFEGDLRLVDGVTVAEDGSVVPTLAATSYSPSGEPLITLGFLERDGDVRPERVVRHAGYAVLKRAGDSWAIPLLVAERCAQVEVLVDPAVLAHYMVGNGHRELKWHEAVLYVDHLMDTFVSVPFAGDYRFVSGRYGTAAGRWIVTSPSGEVIMGGRKPAEEDLSDYIQPWYENAVKFHGYTEVLGSESKVLLSPDFDQEVRREAR